MSGISPSEKRWTETGQTERQPAQQELSLFIYINPTNISIFPASSRMLNLNQAPFFSRIYMSQTGRWTYRPEAAQAFNEKLEKYSKY